MATKMQKLIELSQDIFKELPNYNSWTNFLTTAAWHYKYPFPDQVMIYKQRPDAKACASIGIWNNTLHRWVNKGTKGIALIHSKNGRPYIDYVFDISDTNSFYGNEVKLWEYNEKYNDAIIETLENTFGELSSKLSVVDAVISATHNAVEDNKADYLSSLKYAKENSLLEDLDELNIDVEFQQTAENSVAFMVLERLGYVHRKEGLYFRKDLSVVKAAGIDNVEIVELEVVNADIEHKEPKQSAFDSTKNMAKEPNNEIEMEDIPYEEN